MRTPSAQLLNVFSNIFFYGEGVQEDKSASGHESHNGDWVKLGSEFSSA